MTREHTRLEFALRALEPAFGEQIQAPVLTGSEVRDHRPGFVARQLLEDLPRHDDAVLGVQRVEVFAVEHAQRLRNTHARAAPARSAPHFLPPSTTNPFNPPTAGPSRALRERLRSIGARSGKHRLC